MSKNVNVLCSPLTLGLSTAHHPHGVREPPPESFTLGLLAINQRVSHSHHGWQLFCHQDRDTKHLSKLSPPCPQQYFLMTKAELKRRRKGYYLHKGFNPSWLIPVGPLWFDLLVWFVFFYPEKKYPFHQDLHLPPLIQITNIFSKYYKVWRKLDNTKAIV